MPDQDAWEETFRAISQSLDDVGQTGPFGFDDGLNLPVLGFDYHGMTQEPADTISPSTLQASAPPPKIGTRFSSESVKILRNWFASHERHPYPTEENVQDLQNQTGLARQQVTSWFANARRRAKVRISRPSSPSFRNEDVWYHPPSGRQTPIDIDTPRRRGTPAPFEHMSPLQRWENSPPEHEAATVHDISRAVELAAVSGRSRRTGSNSSVSSTGTSISSGSCSSAHSRNSSPSFDIYYKRHSRRKRARIKRNQVRSNLLQTQNTYQCTFCTETFKTKYDWQRHEKSLHLSLENWLCSPDGPTAVHPEQGRLCVFCGIKNPDKTHLDGHNQSACIERPLEERTYHRKDHLQQHLRLVHASKFMKWPMEQWKVMTQEIRSRCGFCGILLATWGNRVDHLADHFKAGNTMEHWKGDWGFEAKVIDRIDNAMPPYLIHYERNSPLPFAATKGPPDTPTSAYELIKLELEYYMSNCYQTHGTVPLDAELHFEACSIILGAEIISINPASSTPSWLWDIFMSATDIANQARLRPTKQLAESRLSQLKINGKGNIFEGCELEVSLQQYLQAQASSGRFPSDSELQQEACNATNRVEASSPNPSRRFVDFLARLIWGSTAWLLPLRQRGMGLPASFTPSHLNPGLPVNSSTAGLSLWTANTSLENVINNAIPPSSTGMGKTFQTTFERDNSSWDPSAARHQPLVPSISQDIRVQNIELGDANQASLAGLYSPGQNSPDPNASWTFARDKMRTTTPFFLNDNNSYRRLKRELSRFVITTMSPNNPNSHIPSDDELKYQARWILYDDDDPWNQTPVDNAEWLREFKRDIGLTTL